MQNSFKNSFEKIKSENSWEKRTDRKLEDLTAL